MRHVILAFFLLASFFMVTSDAIASEESCATEVLEFSGTITAVEPRLSGPFLFSFGANPSYTVVVGSVESSSNPKRVPLSSTLRLAIHSPTQTFLKDGPDLLGRIYRFEISTDAKCRRTLAAFSSAPERTADDVSIR